MSYGHTARWTAPEILDGEGWVSKQTDIFSFAMVMIEVHQREPFCIDRRLTFFSLQQGFHRHGPVSSPIICYGDGRYHRWRAPFTTRPSVLHVSTVGINATLLGSGPPLTSGCFRGPGSISWFVSSPSLTDKHGSLSSHFLHPGIHLRLPTLCNDSTVLRGPHHSFPINWQTSSLGMNTKTISQVFGRKIWYGL